MVNIPTSRYLCQGANLAVGLSAIGRKSVPAALPQRTQRKTKRSQRKAFSGYAVAVKDKIRACGATTEDTEKKNREHRGKHSAGRAKGGCRREVNNVGCVGSSTRGRLVPRRYEVKDMVTYGLLCGDAATEAAAPVLSSNLRSLTRRSSLLLYES